MSSFAPDTALLGGAAAGAAVGLKLLVTGRPTSTADTAGGLLAGKTDETWRLVSLAGLGVGAAALAVYAPSVLQTLPSSYTLVRAGAAGAAVGAGTALAGGGHGISGLARGSLRSLAAVAATLAAGVAAAPLSGAIDALGLAGNGLARAVGPSDEAVSLAAGALAAAVGGGALAALAAKKLNVDPKAVEHATEVLASATLACGLGAAGVLAPARVVGFFGAGAGFCDPTLAFAVGGALLLAAPATYYALHKASSSLLGGAVEGEEGGGDIDGKLVGGAALIGAGFGAGGLSPASGLLGLLGASVRAPYAVWTGAFLAAHAATTRALAA